MEEARNTAHGAARWPVLIRLGAVPESLRRARRRAALRRAAVESLCAQLVLLPSCALLSAARPYEAVWLQAALATWALWLWPLFRWLQGRLWGAGGAGALPALAEELDRLNPAAPDVFRTARTVFDPGVHAPETRDALESLFRSWEPRLRIPEPPPLGAARRRALVVCALWAALAAAGPLMFPFLSGRHPGAVLYRMALPLRAWNEIPAPRLTPGIVRDRIVRGDTLVVSVKTEHVPLSRPVFARVQEGARGAARTGSPEMRYALVRNAAGDSATFRFGPVTEDVVLRFAAGSALTRAYRIRVVTPPRLRALSAVVTPPAYTRLPPEILPEFSPAFSVLPGTRIAWRAEAERSLQGWTASFTEPGASRDAREQAGKKGRDPSVTARGSGSRFAFALTVRHAADLRLGLTDREDEGGARAVEGPWRIELKADEPPDIALLAPLPEGGEGELGRALKVPLLFRARDDFGISRVRIRYSVRALRPDGEDGARAEGSRDITAWLSARDGTGGGVWDAAALRPQPGDVVELFLEAVDNDAVSGPKTARSATVRLRLPSAEEVRAAVEARERGASTSLSSALERERRLRREAERPDRAQGSQNAEAPTVLGEWEARRILSDGPRQHLQELRRQLEKERQQEREQERAAESGAKEATAAKPSANPSANPPSPQDKIRAALQAEVEAMEKRLPAPDVARAPAAAQMKALEALGKDQRALERKLAEVRPPAPSPESAERGAERGAEREKAAGNEALRENRRRLEDDLQRNIKEQKDLQAWLQEKGRTEAAERKRAEEASRNAARLEQDVDNALEQIKDAMQKGVENGTLTPDMLEKMDRVRELLDEVLDENEKERLRREAGEEGPDAGDMQRAMQELLERNEGKDGLRRDLERAIRMLETLRDIRALRDLTGDMRALEGAQRELAGEIEAGDPKAGEPHADNPANAAALAAKQEALEKRLDKALKDMERLSKNPAMSSLAQENGKKDAKESAREKAGKARDAMEKTAGKLKQKNPDRKASKDGADLAARHLKAAAEEMEKMAARMDAGANMAEMRAVLEETLEFSRWLETGGTAGGEGAADARTLARGGYPFDAQGVVRVAKWLAGRMERLAAAQAFESEALRREMSGMTAQADALATSGSGAARDGLGRHARGAARELLKMLSKSQEEGGSEDGEGNGDSDFGGGEQGESGQEGLSGRMRGVSGKQMAANRLTQELLRSLLEGRRQGGSPGGSGSGGKSGGKGGSKGGSGSSSGGSSPSSSQPGGSAGGTSGDGGGDEGEGDGAGSGQNGGSGGDGGAANAQQDVANALESLAESADDAGGAARKLRQLAEEARALERALRGERLDPGALQKRQEQFRTRLLEAANALEERGQQRERRAEAYAGGLLAPEGRISLATDSLAAELRRRREEARKLPLSPGQKRRVEWYYERLLAP